MDISGIGKAREKVIAEIKRFRFTFLRDVIEPLAPDGRFRVVTPEATFELSKAEFCEAFPNVVRSRSYRESGFYHYQSVPATAAGFVVRGSPGSLPRDVDRGKVTLPDCLKGQCSEAAYLRWLDRKAKAHVVRDRDRGNRQCKFASYKQAIHAAVAAAEGRDTYTGEALDWSLIGKYDNQGSKSGRRSYKQGFALLPTIDHLDEGLGPPHLAICAWRTNDCKSDLTYDEFLGLCRAVVRHAGGRPPIEGTHPGALEPGRG